MLARTRNDQRDPSKKPDAAAPGSPPAADDPQRKDAGAEKVRPKSDPKRQEPEQESPPKHLPRPTRR